MKSNLLINFSIGHCANDLAPVGMFVIIPAFGLAMGLSPTQIGLLFMFHSMGAALAYLPAGMLADHVANRGAIILVTFFWVSFGYLVASFSDGFWVFAILIAIASMGDAAWHPIATGVLAQIHKTKRAYCPRNALYWWPCIRSYPTTCLPIFTHHMGLAHSCSGIGYPNIHYRLLFYIYRPQGSTTYQFLADTSRLCRYRESLNHMVRLASYLAIHSLQHGYVRHNHYDAALPKG